MSNQTYELFTGNDLKQSGMKLSTDFANKVYEGWSEDAFAILKLFVGATSGYFMCEQVRHYASSLGLPEAPSNRAWGSVMARANKENIIKHVGYGQVRNPRAHRCNASLWSAV